MISWVKDPVEAALLGMDQEEEEIQDQDSLDQDPLLEEVDPWEPAPLEHQVGVDWEPAWAQLVAQTAN